MTKNPAKIPARILSRRQFVTQAFIASLFSGSALSQTADFLADGNLPDEVIGEAMPEEPVRMVKRNISGFRTRSWEPFFRNLENGAILVDTRSRVLHYWSEDGQTYHLYPTSVPSSPELTRLGRTRIVNKKEGPDWRPTEAMLKRDPDWPRYMPPGPDNPMGSHALYLSWRYYRIHGTHDPEKIGRKSSNGCIGLYNHHIAELFELTAVGTQVLLI